MDSIRSWRHRWHYWKRLEWHLFQLFSDNLSHNDVSNSPCLLYDPLLCGPISYVALSPMWPCLLCDPVSYVTLSPMWPCLLYVALSPTCMWPHTITTTMTLWLLLVRYLIEVWYIQYMYIVTMSPMWPCLLYVALSLYIPYFYQVSD
jgi:hypothetical protein